MTIRTSQQINTVSWSHRRRQFQSLSLDAMTKKYRYIILLALFTGCAGMGSPKNIISQYPNFHSPPNYDLQAKLFTVMEDLGRKYLSIGMTKEQVRDIFGKPRNIDQLDNLGNTHNDHSMWSYLQSISGTFEYWLVFENDKLIFYGTAQTTWLWEKIKENNNKTLQRTR